MFEGYKIWQAFNYQIDKGMIKVRIYLFLLVFVCCSNGCTSYKKLGLESRLSGDEISIDTSTVINQKLMNEQNAVTPSEVYRNVPGMSR